MSFFICIFAIMKINVLRKTKFESILKENNITNDNVETFDNIAFISILNTGDPSGYFKTNHKNALVLFFDDITTDLNWDNDLDFFGPVLFTEEQAKQIIEFIDQHKDKDQFIIHCSAGISRSGAVGTFINDYLELDYKTFRQTNPQVQPNPFVLSTLKNLIYKQ